MNCRLVVVALGAAVLCGIAGAAAAEPAGEQALTDLVQILRNEGVLDEAQYNQLTAKAAKQEAKESWTDRFTLWGDFRSRYEGFYFVDGDDDVPDRSRLRYRLRLSGKARINDRAMVIFRLASGGDDPRSTNRTLGDLPAFASDPIRIDRAYVRISPFAEGRLPGESGTAWIEFGKVPNPYLWKASKDVMLWDGDINMEGVSFLFENDLNDNVNLFANAGYYVVEERSANADPNLLAAQIGGHFQISEHISVGNRVSWYRFGDVYDGQLMRNAGGSPPFSGGNIFDGMTDGSSVDIIESGLYLRLDTFENWPITIFGHIAANLSAVPSDIYAGMGVGKENLAWSAGAEVGDKKEFGRFGVGWWHVESNAFFSGFLDSDVLDGRTNRKGLYFYGSKQILPNTDIALTTFWSETIDDSLPGHLASVPKTDRVRVRADMQFKF